MQIGNSQRRIQVGKRLNTTSANFKGPITSKFQFYT
jgi:hypothetical protein